MAEPSILIVEDERIVALDLKRALRDWGYDKVAVASTKDEALEAASRARPDLALMDIALKDSPLDGISIAGLLQQAYGTQIVFLTAHGDDATSQRAMAALPATFIRFVIKPWEDETLRRAIEQALRSLDGQTPAA